MRIRFPAEWREWTDLVDDPSARSIREQGYTVVPVPLVITRLQKVYVTYNNALVETRAGERRIYMPVYGVQALDNAAKAAYEAEGFEVLPVRVRNVYRHTGSLRCLVGVVSRGR